MSDQTDLTRSPSASDERCAWCSGPLPAPADALVIVRPSSGVAISTCSAVCMAEWLQQGTTGLRSSIRRSMDKGWGL